MSLFQKFAAKISGKQGRWIILACIILIYPLFISGLSTNPGGFYYDEACEAYNGYLIAKTGTALNGTSFPLFFQCYTGGFTQWMSPLYIYLLAGMYLFVPPSALSAHILSATLIFVAIILLGILGARMSGRKSIGIIVALTGMTTPWLFEMSRMAHEPTPLAFGVALFLFCLYNASRRENWKLSDDILLAVSLAIITYSYAAGRVLGVAFAFGLLIFAANRRRLFDVLRTWTVYFALLIPFIISYVINRDAITARFREVSYIAPEVPWSEVLATFIPAYFQDISPTFLLFEGDHILRHHIPQTGAVLAVTLLLAVIGIVIVLVRHPGDQWWRFMLYALVVSILPGALTVHRQHFLRLLALPIILLVFTIPTLSYLIGERLRKRSGATSSRKERVLRFATLAILLTLTTAQGVYFQGQFRKLGPERIVEYHKLYPEIFATALGQPSRPIYLFDGRYGPAYILALWYGTLRGADLANFEHLPENKPPPLDSVILASDQTCEHCEVIAQKSVYLLYRTAKFADDPLNAKIVGSQGNKPGEFSRPRGVTVDASGNFFVADTGNHRVQKFDAEGNLILTLGGPDGVAGSLDAPNSTAIDKDGNIYVTDAGSSRLIRFNAEGTYQKSWGRPEIEFYGPRKIAIGTDGSIYFVDQGRSRVVKFDPTTETVQPLGSQGSGAGQFSEPSGLAVGDGLLFVTDAGNKRIQVLDLNGNYVREWPVEGWEGGIDSYPDCVFDKATHRLYATSEITRDVIAFDVNGNELHDEDLDGNIKLNKPASIALFDSKNARTLFVLDITDSKLALIPLSTPKPNH